MSHGLRKRFGATPRGAALAAITALVAIGPAAAAMPEDCRVPSDTVGQFGSLPRLARAIAVGDAVRIVAIGSSSTSGVAENNPEKLFPRALEIALSARWPGTKVVVRNSGRGGEGAPEQVARMTRDALAHDPALVIWQLGVNDLLRRDGVADLDELIVGAVRAVKAAGADVLLLDPQIGPRVWSDPDEEPMRRLLEDVARRENVGLVTRGRLMQAMIDGGRNALSDLLIRDGLHMTDRMHECLGRMIADKIDAAVTPRDHDLAKR